MSTQISCWCGNTNLQSFSDDYALCISCHTLVLINMPDPTTLEVHNDDTDLYGRGYYETTMTDTYGYPDLPQRMQADLIERCLHWLKVLLKYKHAPAKTLELGSAHGAFVALLKQIGFDATGLEMSPWLVNVAKETFEIPMLQGPLEEHVIPEKSLDVIALMDVLEHLPDPVDTMKRSLSLLKDDGILLIQTPQYLEDVTYVEMLENNSPFLVHFKPEQHLYLFTQKSVQQMFNELGAKYIYFEPAIFAHYDMFFVVSKQPLISYNQDEIDASLLVNASTRIVKGLLDLYDAQMNLKHKYQAMSVDYEKRLQLINKQGDDLSQIPTLQADIEYLKAQIGEIEADRAARLEVIHQQATELARIPKLLADIEYLKAQIGEIEADRAARLAIIEQQAEKMKEIPILLAKIEDLEKR